MMGRSHALSGWCAGLVGAPVLGMTSLIEVLPFAATTAGFALLPDLDHPRARASRLFGPLTGVLSRLVRGFSSYLYALTKGPRDEDCTGKHRHASHTLVAAVLLGMATGTAGRSGGAWAVFAVLVFGLVLAIGALGDWLLVVLGGCILLWMITWPAGAEPSTLVNTGLARIGGWIGAAVTIGMFVHCLGDSLTKSGCPWLWPVPIRGETWYEIRPPRALRFRTGGPVERWLVVPALLVGGVLLLPGTWPLVSDAISTFTTTFTAPPAAAP